MRARPESGMPGQWEGHDRLMAAVLARQGVTPTDPDWDDWMQEARSGLWRAAPQWTPARGRWSTFVWHVITNTVQMQRRRDHRAKRIVNTPAYRRGIADPDVDPLEGIAAAEAVEDVVMARALGATVAAWLATLPAQDQAILRWRWAGLPIRARECRARFGCWQPRTVVIARTRLQELAAVLRDAGWDVPPGPPPRRRRTPHHA